LYIPYWYILIYFRYTSFKPELPDIFTLIKTSKTLPPREAATVLDTAG